MKGACPGSGQPTRGGDRQRRSCADTVCPVCRRHVEIDKHGVIRKHRLGRGRP